MLAVTASAVRSAACHSIVQAASIRKSILASPARWLHESGQHAPAQGGHDKVTMSGMCFHAYHGVLSEERSLGQKFRVDLTLLCGRSGLQPAGQSDNLRHTINYADCYRCVRDASRGAQHGLLPYQQSARPGHPASLHVRAARFCAKPVYATQRAWRLYSRTQVEATKQFMQRRGGGNAWNATQSDRGGRRRRGKSAVAAASSCSRRPSGSVQAACECRRALR